MLALAAWPLAGLASSGPEILTAGFKRWGSGEFRRFGFLIYEATLWAAGEDPVRPPLALKLTYKRPRVASGLAQAAAFLS